MRGPMSDALRTRIAAALLDAGPRAAHLSINFAWAEYLADAVIAELGLHRVIDVNRSVPQTRYVTGWKADDE